ncbi:hypothetical protein Rhopal_005521-T1 [Rhodotorula paludigena]|uniref:Uncharacterized protein n=1 Tax=Rhodotorula paludigena TaxID=86838 RepID=A0AAV5GIL4_9BASI|nr:hypothetical protein Rhopal_005521-T1 [Rhodotorula paludigena]
MLLHSTLLLSLLAASANAVSSPTPAASSPRLARRQASATGTQSGAAAGSGVTAAPSSKATATAGGESAGEGGGAGVPLISRTYAYDQIPYKVDPYQSERGPQSGYNQCNETTAGDDALCQTLVANDIKDFCLWGSASTGDQLDVMGDIEAAVVAYCTLDEHGARVLKPGALTAVQVLKTEAYTQWTGIIDQTALHLTADDEGGELDPHGADLLGNPLGGLVYSTNLPGGDNSTYVQAGDWNMFIGAGLWCLKLCDKDYLDRTGTRFCENKYDRMGCTYNMPASYKENEYSVCDSELQDVVGVYTADDGQVSTYSQPPEGTAPNPPYQPRIPSTSNCQTYASTDLWPASSTTSAPLGSSTSGGGSPATPSSGNPQQDDSSSSDQQDGGSGAAALAASVGFVALVAGSLAVLA